jgi:hypothetical protein
MPLHAEQAPRPVTLAWLDAEEAILLRWPGVEGPPGDPVPERLSSDVPSRHRATGRVRHDPRVRPGGGGIPDDRLERRREQLLESFLRGVAARIPPGDRVVLLGPGSVRERLAAELRADDSRARRARPIESRPAGRMTERQLLAWLRASAGVAPERRRPSMEETG